MGSLLSLLSINQPINKPVLKVVQHQHTNSYLINEHERVYENEGQVSRGQTRDTSVTEAKIGKILAKSLLV